MPSSRALFLKGILGVAGLGVTGAGGIGLGLGKTFSEGQKDQTSKDSSTKPGETGGIVTVKDADLGIPKECVTTCVLTAEQLKKLKFEKSGNEEITFEGLKDGDEFELTIEDSEDLTNYPKGKKYTLKPKTISGPVTIKNVKEGDIVLENSKEILIREISSGGKLEHLLEEVNELGIPKRCKADEVTGETTKTCELTQPQLQKLKFETRDGEAKTVEGLDEGNIVTLKIEDKKDDINNYPKGKKYTLRSASGDVTIKGVKEEDITLEANQEVLIRETSEGGKLEHLLEEVDRLGIPKRCEADQVTSETPKKCDLIQKQLKDLKFEAKEGSSISVEDKNENSKFELTIEDKEGDKDNYPLGKKYTLTSKTGTATIRGIKEEDITIWNGQSVVIREISGGGKLEKAPEEVDELGIPVSCATGKRCHLTAKQIKKLKFEKNDGEEIEVDGLKKSKMVDLEVEDKSSEKENYPKGKKYTLTLKTGTVTIKGIKGGDIVLGSNQSVVIREKQNERKLEKAPEEIDHLGIPSRCNSGLTCHLTREELQRIKFETKSGSSISIDGLNDGSTVDLKVETEGNVTNYPKKKKYTFKSKSGQVTISGTKDKDIVLEQNKAVIFREIKEGNKLETYLDVLGIPRPWGAEEIKKASGPQTYHLSSDKLKDLRFENFSEKTGEVKVEGLNRGDSIKLTISWDGETSKYPDNRKFSFDNTTDEDIKISKDGEEVIIAKQKESWFKNDNGQLVLVDTKTKSQIEIEKKIEEKKEILKQLGLGSLKIGNFTGDDAKNPTKHEQTNVEFKNESDLKKIQFKELGGGAETVTRLSGQSIRVYLEWHPDANKFPYNMKFLFENQRFSIGGFQFMKGYKSSVVIYQKNSTDYNNKNIFKIEKQGDKDKWYLVRTSDK